MSMYAKHQVSPAKAAVVEEMKEKGAKAIANTPIELLDLV